MKTYEHLYLVEFLSKREMFHTNVVEKTKTYTSHAKFCLSENHAVYETMWKNVI
jgi:hypothetical protein